MKRSVVLIVTDSYSRVLLLKRGKDHRLFPGEWCLPGGKVDPLGQFQDYTLQEKDDEACGRECIEETGYVPSLMEDTRITAMGSDKEYIVKVFRCLDILPYYTNLETYKQDYITREFPNKEHTEFGFFEINRLPEEVGKLTRSIINQIL